MTKDQELWWNWYYDSNRMLINTKSIPNISLEDKISLVDPSFNEIAQSLPKSHAQWLQWYKFGNLSNSIYGYDSEPPDSPKFYERYEILENECIRQRNKVCLLLDDKCFIEPYTDEEREIRLQVKNDILRESMKQRCVFPNRDGFLSGRYKYITYRIDNNHKELLHPEYIVMKIMYQKYVLETNTSLAETFSEYCRRIQYEKACREFKRAKFCYAENDTDVFDDSSDEEN